jgi:hypothetical protein
MGEGGEGVGEGVDERKTEGKAAEALARHPYMAGMRMRWWHSAW